MKIKEVIDKLSSYNLYNYLFPGFVFVMILLKTTCLLPCDLTFDFINIVLIYFIGLIISRVGSLIIEGILKKRRYIGEINTPELLKKLKKNIKFEIIFEVMNMYRTFAAMLILLPVLTLIDLFLHKSNWVVSILSLVFEVLLSVLFTFAYCKQRRKVLECLSDYPEMRKSLFKRKIKSSDSENKT
jgi:hypothetical protein